MFGMSGEWGSRPLLVMLYGRTAAMREKAQKQEG